MATTVLDAPALALDTVPTFTVSAGSNRRAYVLAIYSHGSDAAPVTSMTLGGQTMSVVSTVDDDANTFDVCMTLFELIETGIAAMSGSTITPTGGTYNNRAFLYWSVQGATQGTVTPVTAATSGTSGSVSLARVADSWTLGVTVQDFTGTAFTGLADPAEAAENSVTNADIAYGYGTDTSRTASFTWTHSTSRNNVTLALNIAPATGGSTPTITSTSDDTPTDGTTLTLTVTNAEASQGTGGVTANGVGWTETSWSDTSVQVTVALGDNKYGVNVPLVLTNNSGQSSSAYNVQIQPATGKAYVNLSGTLASSGDRLTATPDLASGDQVEISNVVGGTISDVTVNVDASFSVTSGVTAFDIRVNDGTGWGTVATQYVTGSQASTLRGLVRALVRPLARALTNALAG